MPNTEAAAPTQAAALARRVPAPTPPGAGQLEVLIESPLSQAIAERAKQMGCQPRELEQNMVQHFIRRKATLKNDLGYMNYTAPGWVQQARNIAQQHSGMGYGLPFMCKRHIAHLIYQSELDWRAPLYGGVWEHSNIHLPVVRRFTQQQAARAVNNILGTKPYFAASPVPKKDPAARAQAEELANLLDPWAQFEADESGAHSILSESINNVFIQGEQIVKPIYEEQIQFYQAIEEVAIYADGKPVIAQDGGYIYRNDKWIEAANPITNEAGMILARDGKTPKPTQEYGFKRQRIHKKLVQYQGARLINVPFTGFLAPLTAPTLNKADTTFHLYSEQIVSLVARYAAIDMGTGVSPEIMRNRIGRLVHEFAGSSGGHTDDFRPDQAPRGDLAESVSMLGTDKTEPGITVAEGFGWFDALQDGNPSYIFIVLDDASGKVLYYDWAANPLRWNKGMSPFEAIRINPVEGRWHGRGQVELFYKLQHNIDLALNRWNFSQTKSGRIDVVNRNAFYELADNPKLPLNGGTTLSIKDNYRKEDALFSYYLNEIKGNDLQGLINLYLQIGTNMSGVSNANDAQAAGLQSSDTATGVNNIAQSGDELSSSWTQQIQPSVENLLCGFLKLSAETLQGTRAFTYFAGETQMLGELTPDQVQSLELMVNLTMTQFKARQVNENKSAAYAVVKSFYMELPPQVQTAIAPFVRQWLKEAFKVDDADEIIVPMAPPPVPGTDPNAPQPQAQAPAPNGQPPAQPELLI